MNQIDNIVKEHLYKLLIDLREIEDNDYLKRVNLINEILYEINSNYDEVGNLNFYKSEYYARTNDKIFCNDKYIFDDYYKKLVLDSICYDINVLRFHESDINDSDFDELIDTFVNENFYIHSIFYLLNIYPKIFSNEFFVNRVKKVLNSMCDYKGNSDELYTNEEVEHAMFGQYLIKRINSLKK